MTANSNGHSINTNKSQTSKKYTLHPLTRLPCCGVVGVGNLQKRFRCHVHGHAQPQRGRQTSIHPLLWEMEQMCLLLFVQQIVQPRLTPWSTLLFCPWSPARNPTTDPITGLGLWELGLLGVLWCWRLPSRKAPQTCGPLSQSHLQRMVFPQLRPCKSQ
jgi:hypothetical protein